jgi:EAL domain-containing protein (putative c-di-GMP-specific phosphodiesterase class I)
MPELDGVEVLRMLGDESCEAGIFLVSGMDDRTLSAAQKFGTSIGLRMLGTLQKPFSPEELLQRLRAAKSLGQALTAADLDCAIHNGELVIYYQPTLRRFADNTWDIDTVEALVRWEHPERGVLTPESFLRLGETSGLVRQMTDVVLQRSLEQLRAWQATGLDLGLRVNIPALLISDINFPDRLETLLAEHNIYPSLLTLEVTETATLEKHPDTTDILTRLRVKEVNLALDDFGVGYSSLTQLFQLPFNEMKVDTELGKQIPHSAEVRAIVATLIDLAHKLNLDVCIEGIESEEALDFVGSAGCDSAQGYLISVPVPASDVESVVSKWTQKHADIAAGI